MMLWSSKVAQTNIIPDDVNKDMKAAPFAFDMDVEMHDKYSNVPVPDITVNMNISKLKNPDGTVVKDSNRNAVYVSNKLVFDLVRNSQLIKEGALGFGHLLEWTNGENTTNTWLYMGTIWQKMALQYAGMTQSFYSFLSDCPEFITVLVMPFVFVFLIPIFNVVNLIYGIVLWFTESGLLYSEKDIYKNCTDENGQPKKWVTWKKTDNSIAIFYGLLWAFLLMVVGVCFIVYFNLRVTLSCLLLPFFFEAINPDTEAPFSLYNFLFFKIFFDNKVLLMCCLMVLIVYDLGTKMTAYNLGLYISLFVVCFSYCFMYNAFYEQEEDNSKTPLIAVLNLVRSPKPSGDCKNGEKIPKAPSMFESMFGGFANMFSSKRRKEKAAADISAAPSYEPDSLIGKSTVPSATQGSAPPEHQMYGTPKTADVVSAEPSAPTAYQLGLSGDELQGPEGAEVGKPPYPPPSYKDSRQYGAGRTNKKPSIKEKSLKSRRKVNIK
jgi:hypothetical protein